MMYVKETTKYGFSGHETFAFRYGWLKKGVDAVKSDPNIFSRKDSIVYLGVGKNMVRSIRHWCLATRLIEDQNGKSKRRRILGVTEIGIKLLSDDGWDPYLEDVASLWLLHWLLITNPEKAAAWHITFTHFVQPDFNKHELFSFFKTFTERNDIKVSQNSLSRDADCLIHTYVPSRNAKDALLEDSLDCPFVELGLVQPMYDVDTFRFSIGPKPSLPVLVFGFAFNEFFDSVAGNRQTINIQDCLYGMGSPGQVFKLDENSLIEYTEAIQTLTSGDIQIDETAGLKQVYRRKSLESIQWLQDYYSN
jgi:hypothetical protein